MNIGTLAGAVGKGLFAGAAGTAAMTVSSTLEMKIRGRAASSAPATAAGKVLGVEPTGEKEKERFSNVVHWGYGTGWGAARGVLGALGLSGPGATLAHFGAVWGSEQVMLPSLGVAPPFWTWGVKEVAIDAFHHAIYVAATGAAYELLDRD
ncbi:MAG: hypothetical protein M3P37_07085 [Actinomycetota bacterium]|jgi:hypothetical protein|nr:hypothetical protein [Actinomycetota bacterium]